jgi:uncharacterized protein involved in type VI secretion and phage assembly
VREPTPGIVIGKVTEVADPDGTGRIKVRYPWLEDTKTEWASVASIMAGGDRGCFFMPEPDDEVVLGFHHGDWDHPFVLGFLWNPVQAAPSTDVRQRMIRSKNGHTIRMVDSTPSGGNKGALIIEDGNGNVITLTNGIVTIRSRGHLRLTGATMDIMGRQVKPIGGPI